MAASDAQSVDSLQIMASSLTLLDEDEDVEREEEEETSLLDITAGLTTITTTTTSTTKLKRVVFLLWFGNVTVPLIYMNLTAYDLARCCIVCRTMNRELVVIAEHLVNILHAKYFAISIKSGVSPHVRVPTPGEVLYVNDKGKRVIAGSYLRQLRDMTKQRVTLMGGMNEEISVDLLDMVDKRNLVEKEEKGEREEEVALSIAGSLGRI